MKKETKAHRAHKRKFAKKLHKISRELKKMCRFCKCM
jgi:hypothetical protein